MSNILTKQEKTLLERIGGPSFVESVEHVVEKDGWWNSGGGKAERNLIAVPVNNGQKDFLRMKSTYLKKYIEPMSSKKLPPLEISDLIHILIRYYVKENGGL